VGSEHDLVTCTAERMYQGWMKPSHVVPLGDANM